MKRTVTALSGAVAMAIVAAGCGNNAGNNTTTNNTGAARTANNVTLNFIQNKPEVVNEWNKLIKQFQQQNPGIVIKQNNPPNTDTQLQADVAKGQLPDIVAMGADAMFIQLANNGVFESLAGKPEVSKVSSAYLKMIQNEVGKSTPYALPYTVNAVPVIYNKAQFAKYHVSVPKTWNQLIAVAKKIKSQGGTPFYNGWKDAWTLAVPWNALATNEEPPTFFKQLKAGQTSFVKALPTSASRMKQLAALGNTNQFGVDYNDANTGFANGKAAMYLQGTWVLPVLRAQNPKISLGTFAFPATNNPAQTKMVSGVDSLIAVANSGNTAKEAAAMKFVDFLLKPSVATKYANVAGMFSPVKGAKMTDPTMSPLQPYITQGRVVDFADHYYPAAMAAQNQYEAVLQGSLSKQQSSTSILQQLDALYKQSAAHQ